MKLVDGIYLTNAEDVADERMNQIEKEGKKHIHFAWAGLKEPGKLPLLPVARSSFFSSKYDNTQNTRTTSIRLEDFRTIGRGSIETTLQKIASVERGTSSRAG